MIEQDRNINRGLLSLIFPLIFVASLWVIKIVEVSTNSSFTHLGVYPLHGKGLIGILTGPLIHGDWKHLINNSVPLLFLSWGLFYFYKEIAYKVFFLIYFVSQLWLWFFHVRAAWHIGASGVIYGLVSFLFVSGIIRKNRHLLAISLLVVFLYGSMVWGIFPIEEYISWEGHLMGLIAGIVFAYYYREYGPPLPISSFDEDEGEEEDEDDENAYWRVVEEENKNIE